MTPLLAIENGGYVGAAYVVFLLLLLIYVAIMAGKLSRIQRELRSLAELADHADGVDAGRDVGELRSREREIEAVRQGDRG
jgi:type II secretory pathway component PulM